MGFFSKIFTRYGRASWINLLEQPELFALFNSNALDSPRREDLISVIQFFFIGDSLHLGKVMGNLMLIQTGSMEGLKLIASIEGGNIADFVNFITPSALKLRSLLDRPLNCPSWFVAGYPDVVIWAMDQVERNPDDFAIMLQFKTTLEIDEFWKNKRLLRILITRYQKEGGKLECGL